MELAREIDSAGHELVQARQALCDCEKREQVARKDAEAAQQALEEAQKAPSAATREAEPAPTPATSAAGDDGGGGGQERGKEAPAPAPTPAPLPAPARSGASQGAVRATPAFSAFFPCRGPALPRNARPFARFAALEEARRQAADARTQLGVAEGMKQYLAHKWTEAEERCNLLHRTNQELRTDLSAAKRRAAEAEKFRDAMIRRMRVRGAALGARHSGPLLNRAPPRAGFFRGPRLAPGDQGGVAPSGGGGGGDARSGVAVALTSSPRPFCAPPCGG